MVSFPAVHLSFISWDFYLILAVLAILVPWRGTVRVRRLLDQSTFGATERFSLYRTTIIFQWLVVAVVAWRAFSRNLTASDLGLTISNPWQISWLSLVLTGLLCANQWASLTWITRHPEMQQRLPFRIGEKIAPRAFSELAAYAALSCTAGLSEEFLYRGFVFAVFARVFAPTVFSAFAAAVASSAWFGIGHLYQGRQGVITTFVVGMIFSGARIWTGTLIPSIVAHAGFDLIAGVYFYRTSLNAEG